MSLNVQLSVTVKITIAAEPLDINASEHKIRMNFSFKYFCLIRCEGFLCGFEKVTECSTTEDCLTKDLCSSDKPCDCVNDACVAPWWVLDDQRNCRNDKVS